MDIEIRTLPAAAFVAVLVLLVAPLSALAVAPGPVGIPTGSTNEQLWWVPMELPRQKGAVVHLETTVHQPGGRGPFPLVVINHGSPREPEARRREPRHRFAEQSRWWVEQGYAVVVPMRRGYAKSEGKYVEGYVCEDPDYRTAGLSTANDIRAVLDYFRQQAFVDRERILLVGQSAGGFGVLAAASRNPPGVIGVINFAGGRGSQVEGRICGEARLVQSLAGFGRTARVPALWLYSANDQYFAPALAQRMFRAYVSAGAPAEFVEMTAYGRDGHKTFANWDASSRWRGAVETFMTSLD